MEIRTIQQLRELYVHPHGRAVLKEIRSLDAHCRRFIELSPFLVLSTCNKGFEQDASPRGGEPGFVKVDAQGDLLIPDAPGNNRLDSLENILETGRAGLIFLIPGIKETLRVNGRACLSTASADIAAFTSERRAPKLVIRVAVMAAYLHCAKALMRSKLWEESSRRDRSVLPTISQMISEQSGQSFPAESQEEMEKRYAADL